MFPALSNREVYKEKDTWRKRGRGRERGRVGREKGERRREKNGEEGKGGNMVEQKKRVQKNKVGEEWCRTVTEKGHRSK